jgi:hypothetical protein
MIRRQYASSRMFTPKRLVGILKVPEKLSSSRKHRLHFTNSTCVLRVCEAEAGRRATAELQSMSIGRLGCVSHSRPAAKPRKNTQALRLLCLSRLLFHPLFQSVSFPRTENSLKNIS